MDKSNDEHAQKVFSEDAEAVQMANNIMQRLKDDDEVKGQLFRNAELDASTILSLLSNLVQESAPMKNTTVKLQRVAMKTKSNSGLQHWVSSLLRYPLFGFLRTNKHNWTVKCSILRKKACRALFSFNCEGVKYDFFGNLEITSKTAFSILTANVTRKP